MRPTYETPSDRQKEAEVAKQLAFLWQCSLHKMKHANVVDYLMQKDGKSVAVLEVKCRTYSYEKLDGLGGLMLSAHKLQHAKHWRDTHQVAFILALGLPGGIFAMSIKPEEDWPQFKLVVGGRYDRGDTQDIEPCALIPMEKFVQYA